MKHKLIYITKWFILLVFAILSAGYIYALGTQSTGFQTTTVAQLVDFYDPCTTVRHTGSNSFFVPTNTSSEWNFFKANKPIEVVVSDGSSDFDAGYYSDGFSTKWGYQPSEPLLGGTFECPKLLNGVTISTLLFQDTINGYFLGTQSSPNSNISFNSIVIKNSGGTILKTLTRTSASYGCSVGSGSCWSWANNIPNVFDDGTGFSGAENLIIEIN